MPTSTDTGPFDKSTDLIELIRRDPDTVEPGFRVVEADLDAGDAGHIDLLGTDRHGVLTLMAVASHSPDDALMRLLDGYRWATDQYTLLRRACSIERSSSPDGTAPHPDIRLLLLAPGFTHRFLRRLPLLNLSITPLLARMVSLRGASHLLIEPAASLFGLQAAAPSWGSAPTAEPPSWETAATADSPSLDNAPAAESPAWDRVSTVDTPAWEEVPPVSERRSFDTRAADHGMDDILTPETPLEEAERTARERIEDLPSVDVPVASLLTPADRELFTETLTAEEMEEFERFEHQRRGGDGGLE